jgi:hypothetical protein
VAEVPGHVDQSHDLHLLSNRLLALREQGAEVDVQIANQDGVSAAGALIPGFFDARQCCQVRGWDVTPHDVKLACTHHQMQRNDIGAPDSCVLDLVRTIAPPEEGNPP